MELRDFCIGKTFYTGSGKWICTDIGSRVVVAVKQTELDMAACKTPPFDINETVFDEYDQEGCSPEPLLHS